MQQHLTPDDIDRFQHGGISATNVSRVARHLAECNDCASRASAAAESYDAESARLAFAGEAEHPDADSLIRYVDGSLAGDERATLQSHLAVCTMCRAEASDLELMRDEITPRHSQRGAIWWAAAVVAALAIAGSFATWRRSSLHPPPSVARRASASMPRNHMLDELLASARSRGIERPAFLSEIRPASDVPRGEEPKAIAERETMQPVGTVVESTQPLFEWNANRGHYVVTLRDDSDHVETSGVIDARQWTLVKPLERGRIYEWQIEVRNGHTHTMPAPPLPPAFFRVMDEDSHRLLDEARRTASRDHFLLGVLYAHAGAQREAEQELSAHLTAHPEDSEARKLAAAIARW
jgi:hypothetical protein